jgi:hypothetical protein
MNHSAKIVSAIFYEHAMAAILAVSVIHAMKREQSRILAVSALLAVKAHTDRTRIGNATRIFSFQKQIKPSTDKNFTRYANQIAKIA